MKSSEARARALYPLPLPSPRAVRFVAGWFKIHLGGDAEGVDWEQLIYGDGPDALCGGGDGAMARCEVERGSP